MFYLLMPIELGHLLHTPVISLPNRNPPFLYCFYKSPIFNRQQKVSDLSSSRESADPVFALLPAARKENTLLYSFFPGGRVCRVRPRSYGGNYRNDECG